MARRSITVKVEGLQELGRNLQLFSQEIKKNVLRKAVREAGNKVRDAARRNAEQQGLVDTGAMVKAIGVRRLTRASKDGREYVAVGVFKISKSAKTGQEYRYANTRANRSKGRVGKSYDVDPPEFYWKFHELGAPGANIPKRAFLVPAFDSEKQGSPVVMSEELQRGMDRAAKRLAKGKKK